MSCCYKLFSHNCNTKRNLYHSFIRDHVAKREWNIKSTTVCFKCSFIESNCELPCWMIALMRVPTFPGQTYGSATAANVAIHCLALLFPTNYIFTIKITNHTANRPQKWSLGERTNWKNYHHDDGEEWSAEVQTDLFADVFGKQSAPVLCQSTTFQPYYLHTNCCFK